MYIHVLVFLPDLWHVTAKDRDHTGGIVEIIDEAAIYLNHTKVKF